MLARTASYSDDVESNSGDIAKASHVDREAKGDDSKEHLQDAEVAEIFRHIHGRGWIRR
jgi:predicted regulator of amino acid metabolism with ACT domain